MKAISGDTTFMGKYDAALMGTKKEYVNCRLYMPSKLESARIYELLGLGSVIPNYFKISD